MSDGNMNYRRLEARVFRMDEISVHPEMAKRSPRQDTLDACVAYLRDTGRLKNLPTVDCNGMLLDGYANYLAAKAAGMTSIRCRVDPDGVERVVEAVIDGKPRCWSPGRDLDVDGLLYGDAIAVIDDGRLRPAEFVRVVEVPRGDALGFGRALRRWRNDRTGRNAVGAEPEQPDNSSAATDAVPVQDDAAESSAGGAAGETDGLDACDGSSQDP